MKNKLIILFAAIGITLFALNSCEKSYITGDVQDVMINSKLTSYDYLVSKPVPFDTLVQVINAAGLKDAINANSTSFFAVTDYAIYQYLSKRTLMVQAKYNQNAKWGLDSLLYYITNNVKGTRDSLKMYLFSQKLTYTTLTGTGKFYKNGLTKDSTLISYEITTNGALGYNSNYSSFPKVVYFAHVYKPYTVNDANPSSSLPTNIGTRVLCTSTGINTSNGVVHVLSPTHLLFFNRYK